MKKTISTVAVLDNCWLLPMRNRFVSAILVIRVLWYDQRMCRRKSAGISAPYIDQLISLDWIIHTVVRLRERSDLVDDSHQTACRQLVDQVQGLTYSVPRADGNF